MQSRHLVVCSLVFCAGLLLAAAGCGGSDGSDGADSTDGIDGLTTPAAAIWKCLFLTREKR